MPTRTNKNHISADIKAAGTTEALKAVYDSNAYMINHDAALNREYTAKAIQLKISEAKRKAKASAYNELRALVDDEQPADIF